MMIRYQNVLICNEHPYHSLHNICRWNMYFLLYRNSVSTGRVKDALLINIVAYDIVSLYVVYKKKIKN